MSEFRLLAAVCMCSRERTRVCSRAPALDVLLFTASVRKRARLSYELRLPNFNCVLAISGSESRGF